MTVCLDCGAEHGVISVEFLDIEGEDEGSLRLHYCEVCCKGRGLSCESHGIKMLFYDSSEYKSGFMHSFVFCQECCISQVRNLSAAECAEKLQMLTQFLERETLERIMQSFSPLNPDDRDSSLLQNFYMIMSQYGRTFEEVLTDLMTGVGDSPRNN